LAKFNHFIEEKKRILHWKSRHNGGFYIILLKKQSLIKSTLIFRDNKTRISRVYKTNLKTNLENRLAIVEELKELINPQKHQGYLKTF
jgi:hypothetical protein